MARKVCKSCQAGLHAGAVASTILPQYVKHESLTPCMRPINSTYLQASTKRITFENGNDTDPGADVVYGDTSGVTTSKLKCYQNC